MKDSWEKKIWENFYLHSEVHRNINNDQELLISFIVYLSFHFVLFFTNILALLGCLYVVFLDQHRLKLDLFK